MAHMYIYIVLHIYIMGTGCLLKCDFLLFQEVYKCAMMCGHCLVSCCNKVLHCATKL